MNSRRSFFSILLAPLALLGIKPATAINVEPTHPLLSDSTNLHETMDSTIWAAAFCKMNATRPSQGAMIAWFGNAIMCGYDHATRTHMKLKTFWEVMHPARQNPMNAVLVQAVAMLSTEPRYSNCTPQEVYDAIVKQAKEVHPNWSGGWGGIPQCPYGWGDRPVA